MRTKEQNERLLKLEETLYKVEQRLKVCPLHETDRLIDRHHQISNTINKLCSNNI